MLSLLRLSFFRAKLFFALFFLLYLLALLQYDIYLYYRHFKDHHNSLIGLGFELSFFSYLLMLVAVQFFSVRSFAHEMGNLETLGVRRWQYILAYIVHFLSLWLLGWLFSLPIFPILVAFSTGETMDGSELLQVFLLSLRDSLPLVLLTVGFAFYYHSRKDPFLMLRDKA
ncbi:MAG: hypothetical protein NZM25_05035 [Leptospiraceae bacterium]|nr:hypothetical protein [Leptospiraceae bacterium]MDW8305626.1 hypothetical protein [Leptospiraceae bacterium]